MRGLDLAVFAAVTFAAIALWHSGGKDSTDGLLVLLVVIVLAGRNRP